MSAKVALLKSDARSVRTPRTRSKCGRLASLLWRARSTDNRSPTIWRAQGYLSPKRQNGTVASSTRLNACFAYLVGVDPGTTATDFGPTALRLTGAVVASGEALVLE